MLLVKRCEREVHGFPCGGELVYRAETHGVFEPVEYFVCARCGARYPCSKRMEYAY